MDLIKRTDAIDALNECEDIKGYAYRQMHDALMEIPSVEPKHGEWIDVTERLPENGHYYLWCSDMGSVQSDYYRDGFENGQKYGFNIVAWMPLPKPWKGADNDNA